MPSVNEVATENTSPDGALNQIGKVLPWLIVALAQSADNEGLCFAKCDCKDGL